MEKEWLVKILALVVVLFIGAGVVSAFNVNLEKESKPMNKGNTLYVGGSEEGNYSKIQEAIDNASEGDTIFVYDDSSPYYENINIFKSINLIGENKETTVIDGNKSETVVKITSSFVFVSSFTIINSTSMYTDAGIKIYENKNNITISNCIITKNCNGIYSDINWVYNISIIDCNIHHNDVEGIGIWASRNVEIRHNNISENSARGIFIVDTDGVIQNNTISYNGVGRIYDCGIMLQHCKNSVLIKNNNIVSNNKYGILFIESSNNIITENNIIENNKNAFFLEAGLHNKWIGNYWDKPRFLPKLIIGNVGPILTIIPWVNIDWHPAKEPYDI